MLRPWGTPSQHGRDDVAQAKPGMVNFRRNPIPPPFRPNHPGGVHPRSSAVKILPPFHGPANAGHRFPKYFSLNKINHLRPIPAPHPPNRLVPQVILACNFPAGRGSYRLFNPVPTGGQAVIEKNVLPRREAGRAQLAG